ncbi:unnamed protein product [Gordionus sp. m RMFG-2023]
MFSKLSTNLGTTRQPRPGEINGLDYIFLSLDEFCHLQKSGQLIEYGVYDGNLYGTPLPASPNSPLKLSTTRSTSSTPPSLTKNGGHSPLRIEIPTPNSASLTPSNTIKKDHIQSVNFPYDKANGGSSSSQNSKESLNSRGNSSSLSLTVNPTITTSYLPKVSTGNGENRNGAKVIENGVKNKGSKGPQEHRDKRNSVVSDQTLNSINSLNSVNSPVNYSGGPVNGENNVPKCGPNRDNITEGKKYFNYGDYNSDDKATPNNRNGLKKNANYSSEDGSSDVSFKYGSLGGGNMPYHQAYQPLTIGHQPNSSSASAMPIETNNLYHGISGVARLDKSKSSSSDKISDGNRKGGNVVKIRDAKCGINGYSTLRHNPESLSMFKFTKDPNDLSQSYGGNLLGFYLTKGEKGFGFTILGHSDRDKDYLFVNKILPESPAFYDGNLEKGDILVYVNSVNVLGHSHSDILDLFKSFQPESVVHIIICRGIKLRLPPGIFDTANTIDPAKKWANRKSDNYYSRTLPHKFKISNHEKSKSDQRIHDSSNSNAKFISNNFNRPPDGKGNYIAITREEGSKVLPNVDYLPRFPSAKSFSSLKNGYQNTNKNTPNGFLYSHTPVKVASANRRDGDHARKAAINSCNGDDKVRIVAGDFERIRDFRIHNDLSAGGQSNDRLVNGNTKKQKDEIISCHLTRSTLNDGFGFIILSSLDGKSGSYINKIIDDSPADKCPLLRVGQKILAINGIDVRSTADSETKSVGQNNSSSSLSHFTHQQIVELIKRSGLSLHLILKNSVCNEDQPSYSNGKTKDINHSKNTLKSANDYYDNPKSPLAYQFPSSASLLKHSDLGSSVKSPNNSGSSTDSPQNYPTFDEYHRIIGNHNNKNYNKTYTINRNHNSSAINAFDPCSPIKIELYKGTRGFGFSIRGGAEFENMPLYVYGIADSGPADKDGKLKVGDEILEINGIKTHMLSHCQALELIKSWEHMVRLVVCRPPPRNNSRQDFSNSFGGHSFSGGYDGPRHNVNNTDIDSLNSISPLYLLNNTA